MEKVIQILQQNNLRKTKVREAVLEVFIKNKHAITNSDIEQAVGEIDRITLYRTLNKFEEYGIVHKIESGDGTHYAMCSSGCSHHTHEDDHIHFKCESCSTIQCLSSQSKFSYSIPDTFQVKKVNVILEGICDNCQ